MKNYDYGHGFKPISSWGYVGFSILWSIPVVGWICWLCSALGAKNRNVKNYARSYFCAFLLSLIICIVAAIALFALSALGFVNLDEIVAALQSYAPAA